MILFSILLFPMLLLFIIAAVLWAAREPHQPRQNGYQPSWLGGQGTVTVRLPSETRLPHPLHDNRLPGVFTKQGWRHD